MLKNIKNIIFTLIFVSIIFLALSINRVFAFPYPTDQGISIGANPKYASSYSNGERILGHVNSKLYCIQNGQPLNSGPPKGKGGYFYYSNKADLNPGRVQDYIMAYIGAQTDTGSNHITESYSDKQKSIYYYYSTWQSLQGWSYANGGGIYGKGGAQEFSSWVKYVQDNKLYEKYINASKTNITNNNEDKGVDYLQKETYQYYGENYVKVGPFNFSYDGYNSDYGSSLNFTVTNQNGNALSVKYGKYIGSQFSVCSVNDIKVSGQNFYILVNIKDNATKINLNVKLSNTAERYYGELVVLENPTAAAPDYKVDQQNIIWLYGYKDTEYTGATDEINVNNITLTGSLTITKQDTDTKDRLANVGFVLYNENLGQYVKTTSTGGATYTSDRSQAKEFVTNYNGQFTASGLLLGKYRAYETKNPNYGYEFITSDKLMATIDVNKTTVSKTINNPKIYGDLKIEKVDEDTKEALANVGFVIYNVDKGQYVKTTSNNAGATYTSDRNQAKEFITDSNGIVLAKYLLRGTYKIYETKNPHYGYETIVKDKEMATLKINKDYTECYLTNKRIYVKISGYAWEDIAWSTGKALDSNDLYTSGSSDINDKLLQNVTVRLKDSSGNTVTTTTTNSSGKYTFVDVVIDNLWKYYIEFEYNGMAYESVTLNGLNNTRATDAIEWGNRTTFDNNFAQITSQTGNSAYTGQSNNANGSKTNDIKYNRGTYSSNINYEGNYLLGYSTGVAQGIASVTGVTSSDYQKYYPINGVASKYLIKSTTYNAYKSNGKSGYLTDIVTAEYIRKYGIEEYGKTIDEGINVGLQKRERPDLSLVNDVESVKVSVVNTQHVYRYADRYEQGMNGHDLSMALKFENKYAQMSYTREVYASDVYYTSGMVQRGKPLSIQVTYKISVKNHANTLSANIYQIDNYFDDDYEIISAGTQINNDGSIKSGTEVNKTTVTNMNNGYKKVTIGNATTPIFEIGTQEEKYVYIQFEIKPESIKNLVENNENLNNIAEIRKYGTKKGNQAYAGIDKDSQPGNVNPTDKSTWEDDTDKAPGFKLVFAEERQLTGTVFLDTDQNELDEGKDVHTGVERQGNGKYDESEEVGVKNVKVSLVTESGQLVKIYDEETKQFKDAITYTDDKGNYSFSGFVPGNYKVVYTWGGNVNGSGLRTEYTINGTTQQVDVYNYKSTIVNPTVWQNKGNEYKWYTEEFKKKYNNIEWNNSQGKEIRTSDAVDNYTEREDIDGIKRENTYSEKQNIENQYSETNINSTTQRFGVYIEYGDTQEISNNITDDVIATKNNIVSIDFGIIERARQLLALEKNVTKAKITLANGNVLVNVELDENGNLINQAQYVTVMPNSSGSNGQVKIEVDQEILQGSTLEIQYSLTARNISELDYQTEEFYMYGRGYGMQKDKLVTLQPGIIIDYLDNNLAITMQENPEWESIVQADRESQLIESGLLANNLLETLKTSNKVIITRSLQNEILYPEGTTRIHSGVKTKATVDLTGHKVLASSEDETYIENHAEIIKVVQNNGGSVIETTPGNYVIEKEETYEVDNSSSQVVTIIPPTGQLVNYTQYYIIATIALAILAGGITLIIKFMKKTN